jgi:protein ImuA
MARLAETLAAGSEAGPSALAGTDMTQAWAAPSVRAGSAGCGALAAALAGIDMARSGSAALRGTGAAGAKALAPTAADTPAPGRACLLAAPRAWLAERGLPRPEALAALGLPPQRLLMVATRNGPEALWAAEEALRSGAAGLVIAAGCRPGFAATLRLDHAARAAGARMALLRVAGAGEAAELSAARVRWRIAPAASRPDPWDARAPGRAAWTAEAVRRRDGPPGAWRMEWDDAAHAVRVAGRLADDGLAAGMPAARPGPARHAA